jgi:FkbM family methyltransferase
MIREVVDTGRFILRHPLGSRQRLRSFVRWASWQARQRLRPGERVVKFVDASRLVVDRGMTGATGNIYVGLHEFEPMAFLLHLLQPGDLFVDVGANVGAYTVLASSVRGANSISCEPSPQALRHLRRNVSANEIGDLVECHEVAVGAASCRASFIADQDTTNRLLDEPYGGATIDVAVRRLDDILSGRSPTFVKIDVEGAEAAVLAGSSETFSAGGSLLAVLIEVNGLAVQPELGTTTEGWLLERGFVPHTYDPFYRTLTRGAVEAGNVLFVRDPARVRSRLAASRPFSVGGFTI